AVPRREVLQVVALELVVVVPAPQHPGETARGCGSRVTHPELGGRDRIVRDAFRHAVRIPFDVHAELRVGKAEPWLMGALDDPLTEDRNLLLRCARIVDRTVAPHYGEGVP